MCSLPSPFDLARALANDQTWSSSNHATHVAVSVHPQACNSRSIAGRTCSREAPAAPACRSSKSRFTSAGKLVLKK